MSSEGWVQVVIFGFQVVFAAGMLVGYQKVRGHPRPTNGNGNGSNGNGNFVTKELCTAQMHTGEVKFEYICKALDEIKKILGEIHS